MFVQEIRDGIWEIRRHLHFYFRSRNPFTEEDSIFWGPTSISVRRRRHPLEESRNRKKRSSIMWMTIEEDGIIIEEGLAISGGSSLTLNQGFFIFWWHFQMIRFLEESGF